jgi:hypothetical protein
VREVREGREQGRKEEGRGMGNGARPWMDLGEGRRAWEGEGEGERRGVGCLGMLSDGGAQWWGEDVVHGRRAFPWAKGRGRGKMLPSGLENNLGSGLPMDSH